MGPLPRSGHSDDVSKFIIHHLHEPSECGAVFASFQGFVSPLRRRSATASCDYGGHEIWWLVEAESASAALRLVPAFIASRSVIAQVERVHIP